MGLSQTPQAVRSRRFRERHPGADAAYRAVNAEAAKARHKRYYEQHGRARMARRALEQALAR